MKRIGVVGLGLNNPYFYAPLLKKLGAEVAYVWDYTDENAQAYADAFGCKTVSDIESYPEVDGVLIDSRNADHIELARPFMARDIPVYIEKPLSHDPAQALEFLRECRGKKVFSASPLRFAPSYLKMLEDLRQSGEQLLRCHVTVYHTMKFFLENPVKRWHDDPAQSGGMLTDIGIHGVELMNMFMPKPVERIMGVSSKCHYLQAQCDDAYALTILYQDGSIGTLALQCATQRTDYAVEAVSANHTWINQMDQEYTGQPQWNVDNAYGGFEGTMEAFLRMIETGEPPIPPQETEHNFIMLAQMLDVLKCTQEGK